jgi:Asp-tRNA(Asn)/Glu-tRNA(Gln) amidotransferase B subunit
VSWQRDALTAGLLEGRSPASEGRHAALRLIEEPRAFHTLQRLIAQYRISEYDGTILVQDPAAADFFEAAAAMAPMDAMRVE